MGHSLRRLFPGLVLLGLAAGCGGERGDQSDPRSAESISCADPGARAVVAALGSRLRQVSLLAPDSLLESSIRETYSDLVTPDLLASWLGDPTQAPGREVSSPWPARIDIDSVRSIAEDACEVAGAVVYATSDDTLGVDGPRDRVTLRLRQESGWRISEYRPSPAASELPDSSSAEAAVGVLRDYYAAITARDYRRAYERWGNAGEASGKSFDAFAAGFAETVRSELVSATPGWIEGAAGSRFIDVAVVVEAVTRSGEEQRFEGSYSLRRAEVDGATAEQRRWHIYTAALKTAALKTAALKRVP